ncbi:hypothetical protein G5I_01994 [Acromyrmex echinatior]|uniref:Uncharacterized protein n=1 Tax=Acromyrmex echinatior TaxID=103372 RepID=F4W947_ACREC|nr:hypothetical protein G5I_01994 [Acromyrmex echinatior]
MGRVSLSPDAARRDNISWTIENVIAIAACIPTCDELEHKEDRAVGLRGHDGMRCRCALAASRKSAKVRKINRHIYILRAFDVREEQARKNYATYIHHDTMVELYEFYVKLGREKSMDTIHANCIHLIYAKRFVTQVRNAMIAV